METMDWTEMQPKPLISELAKQIAGRLHALIAMTYFAHYPLLPSTIP